MAFGRPLQLDVRDRCSALFVDCDTRGGMGRGNGLRVGDAGRQPYPEHRQHRVAGAGYISSFMFGDCERPGYRAINSRTKAGGRTTRPAASTNACLV